MADPLEVAAAEVVPEETAAVAAINASHRQTRMLRKHLILATRGSALALWQANYVKSLLEKENPQFVISLNIIKTRGDMILDRPLAEAGGKGLFVKEIEEAIINGSADLAVHSMKDVPSELPEGLIIGCVPKRASANDCFLSDTSISLENLPDSSVIGTSSLRRQAQLAALNRGFKIIPLRGNIDTRLRRMKEGVCDAVILAQAGVERLGIRASYEQALDKSVMLPAAGQGALGIECKEDNYDLLVPLASLEDRATRVCVSAERAFLKRLGGDCQTPIAANAVMIDEDSVSLEGLVASLSGKPLLRAKIARDASLAEEAGIELADILLAQGAGDILNK